MIEPPPEAPRQGIRWARGFLRLWLVLSVIWIVVVAFFFEAPRSIEVVLRTSPADIVEEEDMSPLETKRRLLAMAHQDRLRKEQGLPPLKSVGVDELLAAAAEADNAGDEDTASALVRFAARLIAAGVEGPTWDPAQLARKAYLAHREQAEQSLVLAARVATIPPFTLLFIGALIAWALRGFRQ